ncbi:hypothetical protein BZM26_19270 [Paraburkholderia strydomiana]|nr:hypothetical protein BZM26_19270 [Paraburkholderia strydomiana]
MHGLILVPGQHGCLPVNGATRTLIGALDEAQKQHGMLARHVTGTHPANGDELNKNEAPGFAHCMH